MGFFTWTLANKPIRLLRNADYGRSCLLKYDGYGAILRPDGRLVREECYQGYGMFGKHDVYDLAADWNRTAIPELIKSEAFIKAAAWGPKCPYLDKKVQDAIIQYGKNGDQTFLEALKTLPVDSDAKLWFSEKDWKRSIGIMLCCGETNDMVPYPIKIVDWHRDVTPDVYKKLPPSVSTQ